MDSINVRVAKRLLEIKAVFLRPQEPFTWASGIKSPIYCDNRLILTAPEARNEVEQAIADTVKREYPEAEVLMGTATAGIAHAAIAAHLLGLPMGCDEFADADLVGLGRGGAERECDIAKPQFEQPVAAPRLAIIIALGSRPAQYLDLALIESEALIHPRDLRLGRPLVREKYAGRAALDDRGRDARPFDVGKALGREDHARILLAQRLQPFAQLRGEGGAVENEPALVDDDQRRRAVETPFDTVEEIGEDRRCGRCADQAFGFERLHAREPEMLGLGIEQPAPRAADKIGRKRELQFLRLEQDRKAGEGALGHRRRRERSQRRPYMLLRSRIDRDTFAREQRRKPRGRPSALGRLVDPGERLQGDRIVAAGIMERTAEILPVSAHRERRGADRSAIVEGEDLAAVIAAKLHRHQREQHRLAGAGRADDEAVADVADMQRETERGRAFGLAIEQGGAT